MPEPKQYSYLIRLWQEGSAEKPAWRFVLVNLIQGQRRGFASWDRLAAYLDEQMEEIQTLTTSEMESQNRPEGDEKLGVEGPMTSEGG